MKKTYHIGVDGGATKTTCSIIDNDNNVIATHTSGSTNPQSVGLKQASDNLKDVVSETMTKASNEFSSKDQILSIGLAMSGMDTPEDRIVFEKMGSDVLKAVGLKRVKMIVENDAAGSLCATTLGKMEGVVLISGTGMICLGFAPNDKGECQQFRAGGWGPIFVDKGSGYWIGQRCLEKIAEITDGMSLSDSTTKEEESESVLVEAVTKELGLETPTSLIPYVYEKNDHGRVAKICRIVCENYDSDKLAQSIIHEAVGYLVGYVACVVRKMMKKKRDIEKRKMTLVLSGSVLTHEGSVVSKILRERVKEKFGDVFEEICFPKVNPAVGAALLYKSSL